MWSRDDPKNFWKIIPTKSCTLRIKNRTKNNRYVTRNVEGIKNDDDGELMLKESVVDLISRCKY